MQGLLPTDLPRPFTTSDMAEKLGISRDLAQKMAYCYRHAGAIVSSGKRGNALTYEMA